VATKINTNIFCASSEIWIILIIPVLQIIRIKTAECRWQTKDNSNITLFSLYGYTSTIYGRGSVDASLFYQQSYRVRPQFYTQVKHTTSDVYHCLLSIPWVTKQKFNVSHCHYVSTKQEFRIWKLHDPVQSCLSRFIFIRFRQGSSVGIATG